MGKIVLDSGWLLVEGRLFEYTFETTPGQGRLVVTTR